MSIEFKHSCPNEDCEGEVLLRAECDPPDNNGWMLVEKCDDCGAGESEAEGADFDWQRSVQYCAEQILEDEIEAAKERAYEARFDAYRDGE